jgi:hypothetical protein
VRLGTYGRSPSISSKIVRNDAVATGIEGSKTQTDLERTSFVMTTMRIESNREPRSSILAIPSHGSCVDEGQRGFPHRRPQPSATKRILLVLRAT